MPDNRKVSLFKDSRHYDPPQYVVWYQGREIAHATKLDDLCVTYPNHVPTNHLLIRDLADGEDSPQ